MAFTPEVRPFVALPAIVSLIVIVAGLALGPPGAAVALVFQSLLKNELSDMAVYRYSVRGSWDDPQIEALPVVDTPGEGSAEAALQEQGGR